MSNKDKSGNNGSDKRHSPSVRPYADLNGMAALSKKESQPAGPFLKGDHKAVFEYWRGIGSQVNDNPEIRSEKSYGALGMVALVFAVGLFASAGIYKIQSSSPAYLQDEKLATLMDSDPEQVAYLLNEINIGE